MAMPAHNDAISAALTALLARLERTDWQRERQDEPVGRALIGTQLDALAQTFDERDWDPLRRQAQAALRAIRPRYKLAVLATARDEAAHLPEWIAHHLAIGVEHLFVYSNDNSDGTDELLRWFSDHAPVTSLFSDSAPGTNVQVKAYEHALFLLPELRLYDWVLVIDADEFLVPSAAFNHHLPTLLDAAPPQTAAVAFPWLWRLWQPHFERRSGLLPECYEHAVPHVLFKSAVRLQRATSLSPVHIAQFEAGAVVLDSEFRQIPEEQIWAERFMSRRGGWVDHYWGRSFEEFLQKKQRSDGLIVDRDDEDYFSWTQGLTPANHMPTPPTVIARMKEVLARFAADQEFAALNNRLAARYEVRARAMRNDRDLRALYERLRRDASSKV